jgi:hypothetical protein
MTGIASHGVSFMRRSTIVEIGIHTFGELVPDPHTHQKISALFVGSSQQIIDKMLYQYELFGYQRFIGQVDIGGMPFDKVTNVIELLGTEVAPVVRSEMAKADQA